MKTKKAKKRKRFYTWKEFLTDTYFIIIPALQKIAGEFDGVWGHPRGGKILAVILSHHLGLAYRDDKKSVTRKTLIVDDIADTGKTLAQWKKRNFIVTLFYRRKSSVTPNIWLREKRSAWIVFPWETGKEKPGKKDKNGFEGIIPAKIFHFRQKCAQK